MEKITQVKGKKNSKPTNEWFLVCDKNCLPEIAIKEEIRALQRTDKIDTLKVYYYPDFCKRGSKKFDIQVWDLPNLAIIPKESIALSRTRLVNVVNQGGRTGNDMYQT